MSPKNWAKAINNTNFRKSFLYGINNAVTLAVSAPEGYDGYKLNTITPPSFCATTDGVDYTKCGDLADITEFFDEAKAKEFRDAAVEELTAQGVTFPIKAQLPYNPSSTDWGKQCQVFKQQLEGVLNDGFDFIDVVITEGPADSFLSAVRRNGKFEFLLCNWGADYPTRRPRPTCSIRLRVPRNALRLPAHRRGGRLHHRRHRRCHHEVHDLHRGRQADHRRHRRPLKAFADAEALLHQ